MLDDFVDCTFWCIRPTMLREFRRNPGPMVPYEGVLTKGPGIDSWYLVPTLRREEAETKAVGLQTRIYNLSDLFVDREWACEAYINEQTDHIKKLEEELKQEEIDLLDFILTEANDG